MHTQVHNNMVSIAGKETYQCIAMKDFLHALAQKVKINSTAFQNYERMYLPPSQVPTLPPGQPLRTNVLYKHVQVSKLLLQSALLSAHGSALHSRAYLLCLSEKMSKNKVDCNVIQDQV